MQASREKFRLLVTKNVSLLLVLVATVSAAICSATTKVEDGPTLSRPLMIAWRYETDQTTDFTPAADAHTVFIPLSSGVLVALNAADGKLVWKAEAGGNFSAAPIADERSVFVAQRSGDPNRKPASGTLSPTSGPLTS